MNKDRFGRYNDDDIGEAMEAIIERHDYRKLHHFKGGNEPYQVLVNMQQKSNVGNLIRDAIIGVVVIGGGPRLSRRVKSRHGIVTGEQKDFVNLSQQQIYEIVTNRLSRIFKTNPESQLVPVYDRLGNLLWPQKMDYEEVEKIAEENKKNNWYD